MGLSLFAVLALAKVSMLVGRGVAISPWSFIDDAVIASAFCGLESFTRKRRWIVAALYIALGAYAAINVPLARLTSSALTMQMLRATGSALSDSIAHHLTATNIVFILCIVAAATGLPIGLRRTPARARYAVAAVLATFTLSGLFLAPRGNSRNAFSTLAVSALPHVHARSLHADWREPIVPNQSHAADLRFLAGAAAGRNIVIVALESTSAQYLQPYGATNDSMPNLTKLARQALLFENAFAVYPESIKGLFSVLCSRYPAFDTQAGDYARVRTPALPELARDSSYRTALFHSGRFMYLGMRDIIDRRGFEVLKDAGHIGGNHESSFGIDEPSTVRRILEWIDCLENGERFCLMYLPIAGHHPYEVPGDGPFQGADERTRYLNALHYADAALGELIRGLAARHLDTNTLFVIYGDHGEAFGQHRANFGHAFFLYDENVRVPLVIAAPGLIESQLRVNQTASLIDLAPTIAALLGMPAPAEWQGMSLLSAGPRASLFFTDYSLPLAGIRDGPWKFVCELNSDGAELFDITTDPHESINVAGQHPALVAAYRERLASWAATQKSLLKP